MALRLGFFIKLLISALALLETARVLKMPPLKTSIGNQECVLRIDGANVFDKCAVP
jgi:hypothetical protein